MYAQTVRMGRLGKNSCDATISPHTWLIAHRLFEDSIPRDLNLLRSLINAYFDHVHSLRCLGFIHKPTFIYALERDAVKDEYTEALIYIMCAFGAKYLSWEAHKRLHLSDDENEVPGAQWARQAREMALRDMVIPSVQNLMMSMPVREIHVGGLIDELFRR